VVLPDELFSFESDLVQIFKQISAQYLITKGSIESFDVGVLIRRGGLNELQLDTVVLTPVGKGEKLRAIVHTYHLWLTAPFKQLRQFPCDTLCADGSIDNDVDYLPAEIIHDVQCSE